MEAFGDLEMRVFRSPLEGYKISLSSGMGDEVSAELGRPPFRGGMPEKDLPSPRSYGMRLYKWLFGDDVGQALRRAQEMVSESAMSSSSLTPGGLRLRLWLDELPAELAQLRWEALQAPDGYFPLSLNTVFSRSARVRARRGRSSSERPLRMLQIVSNPAGLEEFDLSALDPLAWKFANELIERSQEGLMVVEQLAEEPTPDEIRARTRRGYHIVYVAAHALLNDGETWLVLASDTGQAKPVHQDGFVDILVPKDGPPPDLVFLATPLTAQGQANPVESGLVRKMLETGVRAVIAIQAPMEAGLQNRFSDHFFTALLKTGAIDVAVTAARAKIHEPREWAWTYPVLTMRTRDAVLFQPLDSWMQEKIDQVALTNL
jgi:hypothetical protein